MRTLSIPVLAVALLCGCAQPALRPAAAPTPVAGAELLNATLYQQSAAEFRALALQVYGSATRALPQALAATGSAALEQEGELAGKPAAVIVDVDETVLDNAPFEARLVLQQQLYSSAAWDAWVQEAAAPAIPGALEFARACAAQGVHVIYLSNRDASQAEITRRNLQRLGFPYSSDLGHFAFRPDQRGDPLASKGARRSKLARDYRIVMLVGDNLGDFTEEFRADRRRRQAAVEAHAARWGTQWFMLPNPMYGSWEDTLLDFDRDLDEASKLQRKLQGLDPRGLGPLQ